MPKPRNKKKKRASKPPAARVSEAASDESCEEHSEGEDVEFLKESLSEGRLGFLAEMERYSADLKLIAVCA